MENLINWFEIPATDIDRAVRFYSAILEIEMHRDTINDAQMGFFPSDGKSLSGAVIQEEGQEPSSGGVTIYLNGGDNLDPILARVESAGGTVIVPKTQVTPEIGFIAMFLDTEGNKIGIHSPH